MKRALCCTLVGVGMLTSCGGPRKAEKPTPVPQAPPAVVQPPAPPPPPPAQEATLLLQKDAEAPVVAVRLVFRSGSVDDPPGAEGLTALTANLMTEATQALDSAQLAQALFPYATDISTRTDRETTVFNMVVHREVAAKALPIFFDSVNFPRLDAKDFARVRDEMVADVEKRLRQADDEGLGHASLHAFLWPNHPYARNPNGHVKALQSLTLEQVRAHREKYFTQARVLAGLGGGFDDDTAALFHAKVALLPRGEYWEPVPLPELLPLNGRTVHIIEKNTDSTPITLGYRYGLKRSDPDFAAMMVANSAFGEHRQMGGRLFLRMREIRGLNYGDYSYIEHFIQEGWDTLATLNVPSRQQDFTLWVRPVEPDDRVFALRLALHEFKQWVDGGITPEEFERTRNFLQGYTRLWEQGTRRKLGWALDDVLNGTPDFLKNTRARFATLTLAEVNAAMKARLQVDNLVITLLAKDATALKEQLLSGAASPRRADKTKDLEEKYQLEDVVVASEDLKLNPQAVTITPVSELF